MPRSEFSNRRQEGAALIYALGALTLLFSLGTLFVMSMISENRQTEEFTGVLRARLAAQAGLERAIAELRLEAQQRFPAAPGQAWHYRSESQPSYARPGAKDSGILEAGTRYTLKIVDAASRIYVNDANANLPALLENLPSLGPALSQKIDEAFALPGRRYAAKEQLKEISGLGTKTFEAIEDFVTVFAYGDPNTTDFAANAPRAPVNVNTASREVLIAVLQPLLSNAKEAGDVADDLMQWQDRAGASPRPFTTWRDYGDWLKDLRVRLPGISAAEEKNLRDNPNPNRRNAWSKTSATTKVPKYTTEFCFHSGGIYEIRSTGEALDRRGNAVARISIAATARIFEIMQDTKREQFLGEDINGNLILDAGEDGNGDGHFDRPEFLNVTWADDCPVNSRQETAMGYAAEYDRVNDSLKLGFWDDFEDPVFSSAAWINREKTKGSSFVVENSDTRNQAWEKAGDKELHHASIHSPSSPQFGKSRFGALELRYFGSRDSWAGMTPRHAWWFGNAYYRADVVEDDAELKAHEESGHDDVGKLGFRGFASGPSSYVSYQVYARYPGIHYYNWPVGTDTFRQATIYQSPVGGDEAWKDDETPGQNPINKDKRNLSGGEPIIQEDDRSSLPRPLLEGKTVRADGSSYKESFVQFPSRVVFQLTDSGPDGNGVGSYVFGANPANAYAYYPRRTYRLFAVNRIVDAGSDIAGVHLMISQEKSPGVAEERRYPDPSGAVGPEINTHIAGSGAMLLRNNASFPSWDNIRVITPAGEYQSRIFDAGTDNVLWGTLSWTLTLPASADTACEKVAFEPRSYASRTGAELHTLRNWPEFVVQQTPAGGEAVFDGKVIGSCLGKAQGKGRINVSGAPIVADYRGTFGMNPTQARHRERFLLYKAWLTSERYACNAKDSDPTKDDARFLLETPVLEDVTITFIPPARIWSYREVHG